MDKYNKIAINQMKILLQENIGEILSGKNGKKDE